MWYEQPTADSPSYLPLSFPVPRLQASISTPALPLPYSNTPLASPTSYSSSSLHDIDEVWSSNTSGSASHVSLTLDKDLSEDLLRENDIKGGAVKAEAEEEVERQEWRIRHPYAALESQSGSVSNISSSSIPFQQFPLLISSNPSQLSRSCRSSVSSDYHSALLPPDDYDENSTSLETPTVVRTPS
jgi:hypothetical protein